MPNYGQYVYGSDPYDKRSRSILLGMITIEQVGYQNKVYRLNWKRILQIAPFAIILYWLVSSEIFYFRERYMWGIPTTRRADAYLYLPETFVNNIINLPLTREEIAQRERQKIIDYKEGESYGRIAHLQHKGEYFVSIAKAALERGDFPEFAKYIGTGAMLSPKNSWAQQRCAELYFVIGRPLDAYTILEQSLDFALDDPSQFEAYLYRCFMLDQDSRVIQSAKKYLALPNLNPAIAEQLKLAQAQANFFRGNYQEASRLIKKYQLETIPDGALLRAQITWETEDQNEALGQLNKIIKDYPVISKLLEVKATWLKDLGDLKGSRDCLDILAIQSPKNPVPIIQSLHLLPGPENLKKRTEIIDRIFREFGRNDEALIGLALYANSVADTELSARLLRWAEERRFPNRIKFSLTHAECLMNANRSHEAITLTDELIKSIDREQWPADTRIALDAIRTVAFFADNQTEIGSINLQKLMQNKSVPPKMLIASGKKLINAKRYWEANNMLIQAHLMNEINQPLLLQIVKLKLDHPEVAADIEVYLRRLMSTRRPPKEMLQEALQCVASDTYLFSKNRDKLQLDIESLLTRQ
jgi:hypothetical protein